MTVRGIMGDLQDWDDAGASFSPSAPMSGTGTGFDSSPIKETFAKPTVIPAYAGIYGKIQLGRLGIWTHYRCSTEFCKGLHQGRGDSVGCVFLLYAPRCGYCLEASMTGRGGWFVFFTLTFDSSPIKGEGIR